MGHQTKPLLIANWKMMRSFHEALSWVKMHKEQLTTIASHAELILCPDYTALAPLAAELRQTAVSVGAQDCSAHKLGPHTGEVSAQSLANAGVTACIIGHHERRVAFHETDSIIAEKYARLIEQSVTPIICCGEEDDREQTPSGFMRIIEKQLALSRAHPSSQELIIAYEPAYAIGATALPCQNRLAEHFALLHDYCQQTIPAARLIYGGNVTSETAQELVKLPGLKGFLVGRASLEIELLQSIAATLHTA